MKKNAKKILEVDNQKQLSELKIVDQQLIKDIHQRLNVFKVNSYDAQRIQRDVIKLAKKLRLNGSNLKEHIKDDVKGFSQMLIDTSRGPNRQEIILSALEKIIRLLVISLTATIPIAVISESIIKIDLMIIPFVVLLAIMVFFVEITISPLISHKYPILKGLFSLVNLLVLYGTPIIIYITYSKDAVYKINYFYIIIPVFVIDIIINYLTNRNYQYLIEDDKNYT